MALIPPARRYNPSQVRVMYFASHSMLMSPVHIQRFLGLLHVRVFVLPHPRRIVVVPSCNEVTAFLMRLPCIVR